MEWEQSIKTNNIQSYSDIDNLLDGEHPFPNYAICLPNYSKLDGNYANVDLIDNGNIGYMSLELSNENGEFETYPTITIEFQRKKTSQGLNFIFNSVSKDYCNNMSIDWYNKKGELVISKDYTPNSYMYEAEADVSSFTKAIITFKSTNKAYRYLWIGFLDNVKISQTEGLKIVYYDTTYQGKEKVESIEGDIQSIGEFETLLEENSLNYPDYALCLPNYSKLDGYYENMPETPEEMGYISKAVSDSEGSFNSNPTMTITLSDYVKSRGISLYQNDHSQDYADEINIKWYKDDEVVADEDFKPNDVDYLCVKQVDLYNKVVIEFKHTSKPYRYVFIRDFDFGIIRIFTEKEITDCGVFQEIDPISTELSINTMDFSLLNINELDLDFQKSQKCKVYFDKNIIGMFFIKKGTRESQYKYSISTEDFISILDNNYHFGGIYANKNAVELINEIFEGESIEVNIDDSFKDVTLTGYLPYDTKRNNLGQIALSIGAIVDTSFDDTLYIYPYPQTEAKEINEQEIYSDSLKINHGDIVTGVELIIHSYSESNESQELFKDTLVGQTLVEFTEPMYNLSISGGTIDSYSVNHAYITGQGNEVILTGYKYSDDKQVIAMNNAYAINDKKIMKVQDATLVNSNNAPTILNRLYEYYNNNQSLDLSMILDDYEVSDNVTIETYEGTKKGIITSADVTFSSEMKAEVKIQCKDN